jgi:phosphoglycolate phosphatase-like HAD superfamily hydrolase
MNQRHPPIVLDLDGVVLQTNFVKHSAMLSLFDVDDARKAEISRYILSNGGVRRDLKISHILRTIVSNSAPEQVLPNYLETYSAKLEQALLGAHLVPGVEEFLRNSEYTFYVSSSAPDPEIDLQLRSRGLLGFFEAVFGDSTPKSEALSRVGAKWSPLRPVFFGDSVGDMEAAAAARTPFVAVVCERDNFWGTSVIKLRDFTSLDDVHHCIDAAVRQTEGK